MLPSLRMAAALFACAAVSSAAPLITHAQSTPSIQRVQVLRGAGQVEIEIEASACIVPQTNVITGPDRLIVDFVNATPGAQLRNQAVDRRAVKSLRVGLFSANPPVTRVVLDLNGPQPYQVFQSGKTIILKIGAPGAEAAKLNPASIPPLVVTTYSASDARAALPAPAKPPLTVSFRDGMLSINSEQANLSEVLFAVHQRTGAEIAIPAGAEQERIVVHLGPAPAPEVLAKLLNGSRFNFLILSSPRDPRNVDQVILSLRGDGSLSAPSPQLQPLSDEEEQAMQRKGASAPREQVPAENSEPPTDGQPAQAPPPNDPN